MRGLHLVLLGLAASLVWQSSADARARVGKKVPWFELQDLRGKSFSRRRLRGRPAVLVVGRTKKAAPPCKKWVLEIIARQGLKLPVYQVIVVDKAWYIPKSIVISKVKDFSPAKLRHRVLLEWYTVFAEAYGIKKHDDPVVLVIDAAGVLRWRHRGRLSRSAFERFERKLTSVIAATSSPASLPKP